MQTPERDWMSPAGRVLVRLVAAVAILGFVSYATSLVLRGPGHSSVLLDGWLGHVCLVASTLLIFLRGALVAADRSAWLALGCGTLLWNAGDIYWYAVLWGMDEPPYPSLADVGWLGLYPFLYAGLVMLVRREVTQLPPSVWLDGLVGGLAAAALSASLFLGTIIEGTGGSMAAVATNLAYPIADLLLLVMVIGVFALLGWRPGRAWLMLAGGIALFAVGDTSFLFRVAAGTYETGSVLDLPWSGGMLLMGLAACQRPKQAGVSTFDGWAVLVMPLLFTLVSLGLLFRATLVPTSTVATSLALCAVLAGLARAGLAFREVRALADSRREARTDELTGLPNRRQVYERLHSVAPGAPTSDGTAVLLVDLDRFKEVNDSLGHAAGDTLLRQIGPRLAPHLRSGDLLGRLGGDEFVVLAQGLNGTSARALGQRLCAELREPFTLGKTQVTIDASTGIALAPEHSRDGEELLQLADLAMYAAKARKTGVTIYDEAVHGTGRHRLETVEQLRLALRTGEELVLHYQPKLDLRTHRVGGVEALVRWQHPERGLLYPDGFIDLAESFGLMGLLTLRVLDNALAQCRTWLDQQVPLTVAVNVSPSNLIDKTFPAEVVRLLERHRLPASALVLEVTESLLMEDREQAVSVLRVLREIGVGVAIDDYGTRYSSLAYLAELPVTELKLDRAFTGVMTESPRNAAIVTSTLQLAHALGLTLVAEGAEDQATIDALAELGCDLVQGYHLTPPLPANRLVEWLDNHSPVSDQDNLDESSSGVPVPA